MPHERRIYGKYRHVCLWRAEELVPFQNHVTLGSSSKAAHTRNAVCPLHLSFPQHLRGGEGRKEYCILVSTSISRHTESVNCCCCFHYVGRQVHQNTRSVQGRGGCPLQFCCWTLLINKKLDVLFCSLLWLLWWPSWHSSFSSTLSSTLDFTLNQS